jgi:hypothetical protein
VTRRVALCAALASLAQAPATSLDAVLDRATAYVAGYERQFLVLAAEERYVQEIRRNDGVGGNLTRANPGGGFQPGGSVKRAVIRSDYALLRLGDGGGWLAFRDAFEVNGKRVRDEDERDRLLDLLLEPAAGSFEDARRLSAATAKYYLGSVTRTINIPTLALHFVQPEMRPRFAFTREREESVAGRMAWVVAFREAARPTLIKTTKGADLALTGDLWVEPATGAILKTRLTAADPVVRADITTTFRREGTLDIWLPDRMEEFYKAYLDFNEIYGTATYGEYRRFRGEPDGPGVPRR